MKVFISHSTKDRWVARQIAHELGRRGFTTLLVREGHRDRQDDVQRQIIAHEESRKARENILAVLGAERVTPRSKTSP